MPRRRDKDDYFEIDPDEIEELNSMTEDHRSFTQSRWWQRIAIGFSALIVIALLLPLFALACGSGEPEPPSGNGGLPVPDFELAAAQGGLVNLSDTLEANDAVVIVFYRGHF